MSTIIRCDAGCGAEVSACEDLDTGPWLVIASMGGGTAYHACSAACGHALLTLIEAGVVTGGEAIGSD